MCLDEEDRVWFMLHSGSRGPGNRIGTVYTELAKNDMLKLDKQVKVRHYIQVYILLFYYTTEMTSAEKLNCHVKSSLGLKERYNFDVRILGKKFCRNAPTKYFCCFCVHKKALFH